MSFLPYPAYKDSGTEWLGGVPDHWIKTSIKHVAAVNMGQSPSSDDCNIDRVGIPFLQGNGEFGLKYPVPKQYCPVARKVADAGDLLFSVRAPVGALNEADQIYGIGRGLCAVKASIKISKDFLWYFLSSSQSFLNSISTGSTFEAVSAEQVECIPMALPLEFGEQTQIARFLDHETASIDALIGEQLRLIELLKEKRQAVISHAVTKGLDPTVPMKDSGVEWLGEVPAHWDAIRSKSIFRLISGYAFKSEFFQKSGDGVKVLITPGSFDERGKLYFSEKSTVQYEGEWQAQFELKVGDLVMVLTDLSYKKLILGRAAFVEREDALLNQRIAKVIITHKAKANYLWLVFNSEVMREQLKLTASGATVFHTSPEKVGDCWMALPPYEEQLEITSFAEEFYLKLDTLIQQVRDTVGLLGERRSALISAAVTGKIDVRGWQPAASAALPN